METTAITITIRKETYEVLIKRAKNRGQSVEEYILYLIEKYIAEESSADET